MTREERKKAIEVLDDMKVKIDIPKAAKMQNDRNWALDVAIQALSQEPCDDAISREDVIKLVECSEYELQDRVDNDAMCDDVRDLPPVTQKSGKWITTRTFMHDGEYYCDRCKCDAPNNEKWEYCPNCGAKMLQERSKE